MEINSAEIAPQVSVPESSHAIRMSKSGVFSLQRFLELYATVDKQKVYSVFDGLRNRFDDPMIETALVQMQSHPFRVIILVSPPPLCRDFSL